MWKKFIGNKKAIALVLAVIVCAGATVYWFNRTAEPKKDKVKFEAVNLPAPETEQLIQQSAETENETETLERKTTAASKSRKETERTTASVSESATASTTETEELVAVQSTETDAENDTDSDLQAADSHEQAAGSTYYPQVYSPTSVVIRVFLAEQVVAVFGDDGSGTYRDLIRAMTCSTGRVYGWTPVGNFTVCGKYSHLVMIDDWRARYCTQIVGDILFHSVPSYGVYNTYVPNDVFNLLGSPASAGCVRMLESDARWLYYSCPIGTPIQIRDDASAYPMVPNGIWTIKLPPGSPTWDPTSDHPDNPYLGTDWANVTPTEETTAESTETTETTTPPTTTSTTTPETTETTTPPTTTSTTATPTTPTTTTTPTTPTTTTPTTPTTPPTTPTTPPTTTSTTTPTTPPTTTSTTTPPTTPPTTTATTPTTSTTEPTESQTDSTESEPVTQPGGGGN